jgi:hypothetical protein
MATNHSRRLDRLEETHAPSGRPDRWHNVVGDTEAELNARVQELVASGQAMKGDGFIRNLIVDPARRA